MKVYINTTDDKVALLNRTGGLFFSNSISADIEVSIVIADAKCETILDRVASIPTVVLVGVYKDKDSSMAKLLLNRGLPQESLIYKDGELLKNHLGEPLKTPVPRGVGYNALKELAEYAKSRNLLPETIVWNPEANTEEAIIEFPTQTPRQAKPESKTPQAKPEIAHSQTKSEAKVPAEPLKQHVRTVPLSNFIKEYPKTILLMRTSTDIDTSKLLHSLRSRYEFKLLDITDNRKSAPGGSLNEAVKTGYYSYLDKELVYTYGPKLPLLVIEFDFFGANADLVNNLYEMVNQRYFVPAVDEADLQTVRDWLNNGLELDGVIVLNEEALNYYNKEFKQNVFTADTLSL